MDHLNVSRHGVSLIVARYEYHQPVLNEDVAVSPLSRVAMPNAENLRPSRRLSTGNVH